MNAMLYAQHARRASRFQALSRRLSSTTALAKDPDQPLVKLYQYSICPFCHRSKALLAYSHTDYSAVEVNPITRKEIRWSKEYKKVPILTIDDRPFFGSVKIVEGLLELPAVRSRLRRRWRDDRMTIEDFLTSPSSAQWVSFSDDELAPLLYPNMCRSIGDAYAAFGYVQNVSEFTQSQKFAIRSVGSLAMFIAASRVKRKRNIADERQALDDALTILEKDGLGSGNDFLSRAQEPNLGDLTVYATLRSIEGLPAHREAVHQRGGVLPVWYERMKNCVERP